MSARRQPRRPGAPWLAPSFTPLPGALLALLLGALVLGGCSRSSSSGSSRPSAASVAVAASEPVRLTLLYTSDEHGWVAPSSEKGRARGGAAELLARWVSVEGHCVPAPGQRCEQSGTVALSGGDNWTGPALSSFFEGQAGADAMRRLGYVTSALGNHELDFGRAAFERNAGVEGFPYVAANVTPTSEQGGVSRPFVLVRRKGVTLGVVGLSNHETPHLGMRDNYLGLSFGDEEAALLRAVPAAYDAGADAVVVVAHVCAPELRSMVARHADLRLAFVGAGHCHKLDAQRVFTTPVVEPGSFLRQYVRVSLAIDPRRAARDRVVSSEAEVVDLTYPEGAAPPVPPDADTARMVSGWQQKTEEALGEVVGHTDEVLEPDSVPLVNFLTDRWREAAGTDVAILNRYGTRQAIPRGPITLQTLYSLLPFNNRLVVVSVTGEQLRTDVTCCKGHVSGVRQSADGGLVMSDGKPIDPARRYTLVGTDYIYFGGSDFPLEKQDPAGRFGEDWRQPLIRWLRAHPTAAGKGLDTLLDRQPRLRH
jgi:5'-nucleotidase / UDP-sugar diphosphatase